MGASHIRSALICLSAVLFSSLNTANSATISGKLTQPDASHPIQISLKIDAPEIGSFYQADGPIVMGSTAVTETRTHYTEFSGIRGRTKVSNFEKLKIHEPVYRTERRTVRGSLSGINLDGDYRISLTKIGIIYNLGFDELTVDGVASSGTLAASSWSTKVKSRELKFGTYTVVPTLSETTIWRDSPKQRVSLIEQTSTSAGAAETNTYDVGFNFADLKVTGTMKCTQTKTDYIASFVVWSNTVCDLDTEINPNGTDARVTDEKIRNISAFLQLILPNSGLLNHTVDEY